MQLRAGDVVEMLRQGKGNGERQTSRENATKARLDGRVRCLQALSHLNASQSLFESCALPVFILRRSPLARTDHCLRNVQLHVIV